MNSYFEAYGDLARKGTTPLLQAGRLSAQSDAERLIVDDIIGKLAVHPRCHLLEIGAGPGNLLIPLSFRVESAVGLDHPDVITVARERFKGTNVKWIGGRFPDINIDECFDAILVYSVLHYLPNQESVLPFVLAAVDLLLPGGRLLIGDLPNKDRKRRFVESEQGRAFQTEWKGALQRQLGTQDNVTLDEVAKNVSALGTFSDVTILEILGELRSRGLHSYVLPQPEELPFGRTREDILVVKPR